MRRTSTGLLALRVVHSHPLSRPLDPPTLPVLLFARCPSALLPCFCPPSFLVVPAFFVRLPCPALHCRALYRAAQLRFALTVTSSQRLLFHRHSHDVAQSRETPHRTQHDTHITSTERDTPYTHSTTHRSHCTRMTRGCVPHAPNKSRQKAFITLGSPATRSFETITSCVCANAR
jgi:hypothetical protein